MRNERMKQILGNCERARLVERERQADKAYLEAMAKFASMEADLVIQKSEQAYQAHHATATRILLSTVL